MVYPGSRRYWRSLVFDWVYHRVPTPPIVPLGVLTWRPLGVVATSRHVVPTLDRPALLEATADVRRAFQAAECIALAGQWPGLLHRQRVPPTRPFVDARPGTVFAMERSCAALAERAGREPRRSTLCVIGGGGFVGTTLVPVLAADYERVICVDPRWRDEKDDHGVRLTSDTSAVSDADLVLVLTPSGNDVRPCLRAARPGQLWADDTFPEMSPALVARFRAVGVTVVKAAVVHPRLRFLPGLPTFGRRSIPGCLVSALVEQRYGPSADYAEFAHRARALGIRAELFPHR